MMSESNGGSAYTVSYHPRLCHLTKWEDFNGYGFNLHAEKGKAGQYIGKVDEGSPATAAKLRQGDRIVEVNGVNIGNENHQQVVQRIKAGGEETRLLVVDAETDLYFKEKKIVVRGEMPEVIYCKTPLTSDCIDTEGPVHVNTHQTEQETGETTQEIIKPAEETPDVVGEASILVNGVKEEEIAAPEQVEVKENGVSECDSIEEAGSKADILVSQIEVTNPEPEVEVPEVSAPEPEVAIPEPEVSVPEPEVDIPEPEVAIPEPEVAIPEPEVAIPEPEVAIPEPEVAIPEPVVATSEPEISVPEPEVAIPVSTPPEAEPVPEPAELKPEPVVVEPPQAEATPSPIPVSPVETKGTDLLDFGNVSVEEMKKRIQSKKKIDTRFSQMGLREKYDLLQRL